MTNVVVVESPAKAKTIEKYLGEGYVVLASYGHVRDLPSKDGSVRPDENFAMTYIPDPRSAKRLDAIAKAARGADALYLATDPDREGEAISWHVLAALEEKHAVEGVAIKRVAFNQVTRDAVLAAMRSPRDLDMDLVNAQQARRALDYLVGFTLSPVLWRKLPGAKSAGRVQSVALRLICEREAEIEVFERREYWSIEVSFQTAAGQPLRARLARLDGEKLDKFALPDAAAADAAVAAITGAGGFSIANIEAKESQRRPPPPFTTSTLQQEASRKLRLGASRTMRLAQELYEGGLITYMRTDGVQIAGEAIAACRDLIAREYGPSYLPENPRAYRAKAKNAQEAHEAIRPTDMGHPPGAAPDHLDRDHARLYELIWKRAVASQMENARVQSTALEIEPSDRRVGLRATGSVIAFDGFLRLYQEGRDDQVDRDGEGEDRVLPKVARGESLTQNKIEPGQHFTEPPPRFTEATLVKRLEELGIGRPSTYASILDVLRQREYVRMDRNRFVPEGRGRLVTAFLDNFFANYVAYGFTADLETRLDDISAGKAVWTDVLAAFWQDFSQAVEGIRDLRVAQVLDALNETLGPFVFGADAEGSVARACPRCEKGQLSLKFGKFGAFVGCSNYPECRFTRQLGAGAEGADGEGADGTRILGTDPDTDLAISLRVGPYGTYVQLGEPEGEAKPKRVSLPKQLDPAAVDLDLARRLLALPRSVGRHPESGQEISAGIGRYGPYLKHDKEYRSLAGDDDVLTVGLNRAVALLAEPKGKRRGAAEPRALGDHPETGQPVRVMDGRYGPYVTHARINASLPRTLKPEDLGLEQALELLREREAKAGKGGGKKPRAKPRKAAKRKPAARRPAAS